MNRFDHILYIPKLSARMPRVYNIMYGRTFFAILAGKRYSGEIFFTDCERVRSVGETCGLT